MFKLKYILAFFGAVLIFVVWKLDVFAPKNSPVTNQEPTSQVVGAPSGEFKHSILGFSFKYDPKIFSVSETLSGATLTSPYYVMDNPSGIPANERKHAFSITLEGHKTETLQYIKSLPYGGSFMSMFPDGTLDSFTADGGFAEKVSLAGFTAYKFTVGVEGTNVDYYFVPLTKSVTGVIAVSYFTDFLKDGVKPEAFSEAQEKEAVNYVLNSLTF